MHIIHDGVPDMKRTTKLYDFSPSTAVIVCAAYAMLLTLFGYTWLSGDGSVISGVIFALLALSFIMVLVYFVILSPKIKGKTLYHGNKQIRLKSVKYKAAYDPRLKEKVIVFWDKKTEIKYLSNDEYKKKTIRVQATPSNLRKAGEWLGTDIPAPEKPKKKKNRK